MDRPLTVGVDLGGTKIEAVVLRAAPADGFEVVERLRTATPREEGYEAILAATAKLIFDVTRAAGLGEKLPPIGVGMPGGITRKQGGEPLVKNSNTTCLNGRPFRRDLQAKVGAPIAFANDANCFALAETRYGAARGAEVTFGVIMGTGVGGGVVLRGELWDGAQGIAGEWGHIALEPARGPACFCGRRGCVERYLSGPAIEEAYAARAGVARGLREIVARRKDDPHADQTLTELADVFGRALATVIAVLDPSVIVLGGGVSNLDLLYDEGIAAVGRWVFNDEVGSRIVRHALGDSAGVIGAALLPSSAPATQFVRVS
jgi:fructokinase